MPDGARGGSLRLNLRPQSTAADDILPCPELKVDQAAIGVVTWIWRELEAHAFDQALDASIDDLLTGLLVALLRIHHLAQREQTPHHLLRQR